MSYAAPVHDMMFTLREIVGIDEIATIPGYGEATSDLAQSVLSEAAKFAEGVLAPLNRSGDEQGSRLADGAVRTPDGFREAYAQFVEAGWNGIPFPVVFGGQGLPWTLSTAVQEMWNSANMAFALCPLLTQGAVELLERHGSDDQQRRLLPHLVRGDWTGTMNLTEPQAGTDLGAVRTRAVRDGAFYRITGQKIFITYGEHDLAENIVHMVLARTPDAPPGVKGISLFIVPKLLPDGVEAPSRRNDLRCVTLERKLGIHASPTAVMAYGDGGGAFGELVGEENRGIEYMFTMMNNARLSIGVQGLAIAERAFQQARDYAQSRVQGRAQNGNSGQASAIVHHPDVRRMLITMRAQIDAMRAIIYFVSGAIDRARHHPDPAVRSRQQALADLLIPVAKAWCTDTGCAVASIAIQVHGGVGYIEPTGAAQHLRDARITPIYEGTNGIQAIDLLGRKLARDNGAAASALLSEMRETARDLKDSDAGLSGIADALKAGVDGLGTATEWLLAAWTNKRLQALAGATPYLALFGTVVGGWLLGRAALAASHRRRAGDSDKIFLEMKIALARFYADNRLPLAQGLAAMVTGGSESVLAVPADQI